MAYRDNCLARLSAILPLPVGKSYRHAYIQHCIDAMSTPASVSCTLKLMQCIIQSYPETHETEMTRATCIERLQAEYSIINVVLKDVARWEVSLCARTYM